MGPSGRGGPAGCPRCLRRARSSRPSPPPLRLTRRGRVVLAALVSVLLAALVSVAFALAPTPAEASGAGRVHVVRPGETLWAVASQVGAGANTRDVVERLIEANGLHSPELVAGQRLVLPPVVTG